MSEPVVAIILPSRLVILSFCAVACIEKTNHVRQETKALKSGSITACTYGVHYGKLMYVVFQNATDTLVNQVEGELEADEKGILLGSQWLTTKEGKKIRLAGCMKMYELTSSNIVECKLTLSLQDLERYLKKSVSAHTISNVHKFLNLPVSEMRVYSRNTVFVGS